MIYDDVNATKIIFIQLHTLIGMVLKFYTLLAPNRQPDKRIKKSKVKKKQQQTKQKRQKKINNTGAWMENSKYTNEHTKQIVDMLLTLSGGTVSEKGFIRLLGQARPSVNVRRTFCLFLLSPPLKSHIINIK